MVKPIDAHQCMMPLLIVLSISLQVFGPFQTKKLQSCLRQKFKKHTPIQKNK